MKTRKSSLRFAGAGLVVVLALLLSGVVSASPPQPGAPQDAAGPVSADDGILEVGGEYSSADAPPAGAGGSDLPYTADSVRHFYDKMRGAGYTGSSDFIYGNSLAWETDWKRAALGGSENSYVDNVDIMFFHDHGGSGSMWFPWGHTDTDLVPNDCAGSWGDKDVEWIGIKSCLTLVDRTGWATCMNGAHLIAGMTTISYGADYGGDWADQLLGWNLLGIWLRAPKSITQAWFTACDANQPSSVSARVIAEDWRHFDDKVWNRGGPVYGDVVDNTYFWLDHACFKPPARQVDADALSAAAVQTYPVTTRNVNEGYATGVAGALGLQGTPQLSPDGTEWSLTASQGGQTLTLSIPTASGGFVLQNTSQLWAGQDPTQPLALPDRGAAISLAGSYLDGHQALPGSSNVYTPTAFYLQDTQTEAARQITRTLASGPDTILQIQGTDAMVAYGRSLSTGVAVKGATVAATTVGPGSVTKLYYGGASAALRDAPTQAQLPIGMLGGSRDVTQGSLITTQPYTTTWNAFVADHQLAIVPIPVGYDRAELLGQTFSYYEQPQNVPQQELIPVWVFTANLYQGQTLVGPNATVYVPASPDYYPPDVTINTPAANSTIVAGTAISLTATTGGAYAPFTFAWTSSTQGQLGTQEDIKTRLQPTPGKEAQAAPQQVTLTLTATNQNGQSRSAEVVVNVVGTPVWLPLIKR